MTKKRFHPWVIGTQHLGDTIVRIHFGGGVVRDVDLRAVLSSAEMEALTADPGGVAAVRTTVMWPNGVQISPQMLDLILAGFGEPKGWPATPPPVVTEAGRQFAVPSLVELGVVEPGGADPSAHVMTYSGEPWRRERIELVLEEVRRACDGLLLWWPDVRDELQGTLEGERRRELLRRGLTEIGMLWLALGLEQLVQDAGWADALIAADADVRELVVDAFRWNE